MDAKKDDLKAKVTEKEESKDNEKEYEKEKLNDTNDTEKEEIKEEAEIKNKKNDKKAVPKVIGPKGKKRGASTKPKNNIMDKYLKKW